MGKVDDDQPRQPYRFHPDRLANGISFSAIQAADEIAFRLKTITWVDTGAAFDRVIQDAIDQEIEKQRVAALTAKERSQ